jgi:hypothetical protein
MDLKLALPNLKGDVLVVFNKKLQVDLEHSLQEAHVRAVVQADLRLPHVDEQDLARGEREEGALALKVLVLAALLAVGAFDVHDEDVVGHGAVGGGFVFGEPYTLSSLFSLLLVHHAEAGPEQGVEEGRLAGGLGAKHGDEVVVEADGYDLLVLEVEGEVLAGRSVRSSRRVSVLELGIVIDDLDAHRKDRLLGSDVAVCAHDFSGSRAQRNGDARSPRGCGFVD